MSEDSSDESSSDSSEAFRRSLIVYDMNDGLVALFQSFMVRNEIEDAVDFICECYSMTPTSFVINEIIFKIMMTCNTDLAYKASMYLERAVKFMPTDDRHILILIEGLKDSTGSFRDVWDAFSHFVWSSLHHRGITDGYVSSQEFVKSENCDYLVDIYVKGFLKCPSNSTIFGYRPEENFSSLMKWINVFYKYNVQMDDVLESLHLLLDHIIECEISTHLEVPKFAAFHTAPLSQYVLLILSNCKEALAHSQNQQRFFNNMESHHLIVKICQYILDDLIDKEPVLQNSVLTLKSIVKDYFFNQPKQSPAKASPKPVSMKFPKMPSRGKKARKRSKNPISGDTKFHVCCRSNKFADLLEALFNDDKTKDINVKNGVGNTPLHEACLARSYHCCKFLIEDAGDRKVDFKAVDNEGRTPLHFAVYQDASDIVKLLLERGGSELTKCRDNDGNKPIDYSKSEEMRNLVHRYELKVEPNDDESQGDSSSVQQELPNLKNSQNYPRYLRTLRTLITNYCEIYDIPKESADIKKLSHSDKECSHYKASAEETLCMDDSSALATFEETIKKLSACAKRVLTEVNIKEDIRYLEILAASFH